MEKSSRQEKKCKFQDKGQKKSMAEENDKDVDILGLFKILRNSLRKVNDPLYEHLLIFNVK